MWLLICPYYYFLLDYYQISLIYIFQHLKNQTFPLALFWDPKKQGHCLTTYQTAVVEVILAKSPVVENGLDGKHDLSLEREVRKCSPFLNWTHFTKEAMPVLPGHRAELPSAAGCSCSIYQHYSLFHKHTRRASGEYPVHKLATGQVLTGPWENPWCPGT